MELCNQVSQTSVQEIPVPKKKQKRKKERQLQSNSSNGRDCEEEESANVNVVSVFDPTFKIKHKKEQQLHSQGTKVNIVTVTDTIAGRSRISRELLQEEEFSTPYSFDVTPDCQKRIAKKLAKTLDRTIQEVNATSEECENKTTEDKGIYLFSTSYEKLSLKNLQNEQYQQQLNNSKRKKPELKRKRQVDDTDSETEDEKLRAAAVSADWVINKSNY